MHGKSFFSITDCCGSPGYTAPELMHGELTVKADVYSMGIVSLYTTHHVFEFRMTSELTIILSTFTCMMQVILETITCQKAYVSDRKDKCLV